MVRKTVQHPRRWSSNVTKHSRALDLDKDVFTWKNPKRIAVSLKKSAEKSTHRKTTPYASAMSMLNFYLNRAGTKLDSGQKKILKDAKNELRHVFNRD